MLQTYEYGIDGKIRKALSQIKTGGQEPPPLKEDEDLPVVSDQHTRDWLIKIANCNFLL